MLSKDAIRVVTELGAASLGIFRGRHALERGVSRKQLSVFSAAGIIERELPGVYRMTVFQRSAEQRLRAALMWAGDDSVAARLSAAALYKLEGVHASVPEIFVPSSNHVRSPRVVVRRVNDMKPLMVRTHRGLRVTGVEATLVALAHALDGEAFEIACEDARRRRLTGIPALRAYLTRFGRRGLPGISALRELLEQLDPRHPSRSTLEVKTRRLLVARGISGFTREFPLEWAGRTHQFDFCFPHARTILETNGRRWHDDPLDYEDDNEKWSIPGRCGYRVVFATWEKVTEHPDDFVAELHATLGG